MTDKNAEPAKNPAPGPQSTKTLTPTPVADKDAKNPVSDNTPSPTQERPAEQPAEQPADAPELTKEEQDALEAILGDDDESTDPDRPAVTQGHVASAATKLQRLVARVPQETPNEHIVWGAAGVTLTLGDLRELAKVLA